jgi:isocitrate dehydrogenase
MLIHIGQSEVAQKVHNAWLRTLEDGIHTYDIFQEGVSTRKVGTKEFAEEVIARLGQSPVKLKEVLYEKARKSIQVTLRPTPSVERLTIGVDIFLYCEDRNANIMGNALKDIKVGELKLSMITNRGVKVYPDGLPETFCTDHWRCRFKSEQPVTFKDILELQQKIAAKGYEIIKTENLCTFDGVPGFSAGQGA